MKYSKTVLIFFFSLLFLNVIFSENTPEELTIHPYEFFETYGKSQAQLYEDAATLGYRDLFELSNDLGKMSLNYTCDEPPFIEEARFLFVRCTEMLKTLFLKDNYLRDNSSLFPCSSEGPEIIITFFSSCKNNCLPSGYTAFVSNIKGTVFYRYYDEKKNKFEILHKEPYTNALKIIEYEMEQSK